MTEFKNTPEQRLKIAKLIEPEGRYYITFDNSVMRDCGIISDSKYDPLNNAEQLLELVKLLLKLGWTIERDTRYEDVVMYSVFRLSGDPLFINEELEQAIMQAVWEIAEKGDE